MLKQLINLFIKQNGRKPNAIELLKLKFKASGQTGKEKVLKIPTEYKKPPSPKKEEGIPIFADPIQQQGLKFFKDLAGYKLPVEKRVYGPFGKGSDGFRNMMLWMMQNTPQKTMEAMKQYGWKPKVVSKTKEGLSSLKQFTKKENVFEKSEEAARISIAKLKKDLPHMNRNEIDQLTKDLIDKKLFPDFDQAQRKEVFDAIEYQTTNKPDFASGGRAGLREGGRTGSGLNYLLGEDDQNVRVPFGSGSGKPPVTYGPPIEKQKQTPRISMFEQLIKEKQELEFLKKEAQGKIIEKEDKMPALPTGGIQAVYDRPRGTFEGNSLSDFKQAVGDVAAPPLGVGYFNMGKNYETGIQAYPNKITMGGRMTFKEGGPPNPGRRNFMKLAAGLASLPFVGKFFKLAKPAAKAAKIAQLKNTTTTMPAWFPNLVDKFMNKGVGKKIDADLMQYKVKDLPDVALDVQSSGKLQLKGKNAYNEEYIIDYEPPGYEVLDEVKGKAVKTKGDFVATDTQYRRVGPEMDDFDVDGVNVNSVDELLGGSSSKLENFAKGKKGSKKTIGEKRVDEASASIWNDRADVYEPYADMDPTDFADDFAKGGIAGMLGE